jgi:hypothetical protein
LTAAQNARAEMRLRHPTDIGARAEAAVASALVRAGKPVFLPVFGVNTRIDLVYGETDRLVRVQCKTSRVIDEVLVFRTCSTTNKHPRDSKDQVDVLGIYSPALALVYLVPVDELPITAGSPRLSPARNGQRKRIMWADDYVLGPP